MTDQMTKDERATRLKEIIDNSSELQELEIRVNLAAITFGDLEMVMGYEDGKVPMTELMPFLNRVIVGGVKDIPVLAYPKVMDALADAFSALVDTKN